MNGGVDEKTRVLEALKNGLELESNGIRFYTQALESVRDPKGCQTLRYLVNEERDHLKFINDIKGTFEDDSKLKVGEIATRHLSVKRTKVFPKLEEFIHEVSESHGDKKILEEAETIEKRSIEFYKESGVGILNNDYQKTFDILIEEEEGHLKLVMQMSDYMTLHGVWTGLEEYFVNE